MRSATARSTAGQPGPLEASARVAVVAANLYVIFFNFSWGPVMWVMLGEMFPNQIRGSALAVSGFVQWFANFVISFSFPVMAASWGLPASYAFYGVCAAISFFLVKSLVRETRGKELEHMEGMMSRQWGGPPVMREGLRCLTGKPPSSTPFRSREWFERRAGRHGSALSRALMTYGFTREELRSGRPIVGIAQSGSDLAPCNRIHLNW